jgi:CheY-like chemotaxis protein
MLTNWGMNPDEAENGKRAWILLKKAKASGKHYPLILLDNSLPDADGFEFAESINTNEDFKNSKILLLTSIGFRGDAARSKKAGISAYLMKPVKQSELFDAILHILGYTEDTETSSLITRHTLRESRQCFKILLAEDNVVSQKVAVKVLEKRGHHVTAVKNGKEAVEQIKSQKFDLILMDVEMPEMNGFEATAAIRKSEEKNGGHIPIIAMTAHAMKGDQERCMEAGMDGYVSKPLNPDVLFDVINQKVQPQK